MCGIVKFAGPWDPRMWYCVNCKASYRAVIVWQ